MKEFEDALNRYSAAFGENYPLVIAQGIDPEEIVADINRCIETGEKAQTPQYEDDLDY